MSTLIDNTYFFGDIFVPTSSNDDLNGGLNDSIALYEPEVLKSLLGYMEFKDMMAAYNDFIDHGTALPQKWDKLINGAEFSFNCRGEVIHDYWIGLVNTSKISMISYWVYYNHRRNNVSQFNGIGETVSKSENSNMVSPRYKMKVAWNKFVTLYGESFNCSHLKSAYVHWNTDPSAYNFLLANIGDYPQWRFEPHQKDYSL